MGLAALYSWFSCYLYRKIDASYIVILRVGIFWYILIVIQQKPYCYVHSLESIEASIADEWYKYLVVIFPSLLLVCILPQGHAHYFSKSESCTCKNVVFFFHFTFHRSDIFHYCFIGMLCLVGSHQSTSTSKAGWSKIRCSNLTVQIDVIKYAITKFPKTF